MIDLTGVVDEKLLDTFLVVSESDAILQAAIKKSKTSKDFMNSLMAAIILMKERERVNQEEISNCLKSNPDLVKYLEEQKKMSKT